MNKVINYDTFEMIMDGIHTAVQETYWSMTHKCLPTTISAEMAINICRQYLENENIEIDYEDADDDDIPDDVDESNYNPYMGQDEFEIDEMW